MKHTKIRWIIFAGLAIIVGLYPLLYLSTQMRTQGLLLSKPIDLQHNKLYPAIFYVHISFGGIALFTGWSQFNERLRARYLKAHRSVGKIYVISVLLSSVSGLTVALFATGGLISAFGFFALALTWLFTIIKAYTSIRNKDVQEHQLWMIRNYALTFAAVTLRLLLPFSQAALHMDFILAYRIISWLSWLPNMLVAELIVYKRRLVWNSRVDL
jgi:uncharacterized membrane protein